MGWPDWSGADCAAGVWAAAGSAGNPSSPSPAPSTMGAPLFCCGCPFCAPDSLEFAWPEFAWPELDWAESGFAVWLADCCPCAQSNSAHPPARITTRASRKSRGMIVPNRADPIQGRNIAQQERGDRIISSCVIDWFPGRRSGLGSARAQSSLVRGAFSMFWLLLADRWSFFRDGRFMGKVLDEWIADSQEFVRKLPHLVAIALIALILNKLLVMLTRRMVRVA